MSRQDLEKYQIVVYLAAIGSGLALGTLEPNRFQALEALLWPLLAFLLYFTFTQVPLAHMRQAILDTRFTRAAIIGNFVVVPITVAVLVRLLPDDLPIRLGVLLVLLVPCTDWFITFTHLGGGATRYAIAFSPVSLLLQVLFLPLYLWLFLGEAFVTLAIWRQMLPAFAGIVALPLLAAIITERWVERASGRRSFLERLAWFPVPTLAVVLFVIATTQVGLIPSLLPVLPRLLLVFAAYLGIAALIARGLDGTFALPTDQGRALAFSLGTRNSFLVLPLALALPSHFEGAVAAVVFQSLVELSGMMLYLWWVPNKLFPLPTAMGTVHTD